MENKEKILTVSEELFRKYGLRSVSMDDIARQCGMSKKTIYQDFCGKEALVKELVKNRFDEDAAVFNSLHDSEDNAIVVMCQVARRVTELCNDMEPMLVYDIQKYYNSIWLYMTERQSEISEKNIKRNLEQGIREGVYREDLNIRFVTRMYLHMNLGFVNEEIFPNKEFHKSTLFKDMIDYHMSAILNDKGREIFNKIEL